MFPRLLSEVLMHAYTYIYIHGHEHTQRILSDKLTIRIILPYLSNGGNIRRNGSQKLKNIAFGNYNRMKGEH